jgi:6-phosphogluconolactonase
LNSPRRIEVGGAPGALVVDPAKKHLYAAIRSTGGVATLRIDATGGLTLAGTTKVVDNPVYLATDKAGRFLLTAYYGAGKAAIYPIEPKGTIGGQATQVVTTDKNPHSIMADPSGRFVFVPNTGADKILQFKFDAQKGQLAPNDPPFVATEPGSGPRHFYFHPTQKHVYAVNEKNSTVTAFKLQPSGTLEAFQTIPTLPQDFQGNNTCAHIEITPSGKFLYASNRGHDSIACYAIDPDSGRLSSLGQQPTEKTPRAFNLDPTGNFLLSAGQASHQLATYRVEGSGKLRPLDIYPVGKGPAWVLVLKLE